MKKQKSNVFLKTSYNPHAGEQMPCCHLSDTEMIEFLEKIQNTDIPHESCIMSLSASIIRTATTAYKYKSHSEELNIYMHPFQKKCAIRDKKNCVRCIASGKCRDEFVIDLIGKKLFADKYEKQK